MHELELFLGTPPLGHRRRFGIQITLDKLGDTVV